jgi:hypothetical protein
MSLKEFHKENKYMFKKENTIFCAENFKSEPYLYYQKIIHTLVKSRIEDIYYSFKHN